MATTDPAAPEAFAGDPARRGAKSAGAFRTISEVATDLNVPQHVLRFWETRFAQIRPLKRAGGRRYYRPEDVDLLRRIRDLLYRHGYTIRGAQRLLREHARGGSGDVPPPAADADAETHELQSPEPAMLAPPQQAVRATLAPELPLAPAPSPAVLPSRRGDHIGEVIAELAALRDLLRARTRK